MIIIKKNDYAPILIVSFILVFLKYFLSYLHYPNDFIITKILIETEDIEYYPLVKSLSELNLFISFNKDLVAKNILTFPIFSIIFHSLFYKILGILSFIFLEFVFKFLLIYIFFKIFREFNFSKKSSILFAVFIILIPSLLGLFDIPKTIDEGSQLFKYLQIINELMILNLGSRFPRPLVTHFYLYLFIFLLIVLNNNLTKKNKLTIYLSIILAVIANSFFYVFIACALALFFLFINDYKKYIFYIKNNHANFIFSLIIFILGFIILVLQNAFGEKDYSSRIGLFEIDYKQKIFLLKYFINNCIIRKEVLILIGLCAFSNYFIKKFIKIYIKNLHIFSYFILASILSPFFFVIISSKIINIYQFFDFLIFVLIFYNIFCGCLMLNYYFKENIENVFFIYIALCIFFILYFFSYNLSLNKKKLEREDLNFVGNFLKKNNLYKTDKILYTNNLKILNFWLLNNNKYLLVPASFSNSLQDEQIEDHLLHFLHYLKFPDSKLKSLFALDLKKNPDYISLPWSLIFSYKYQANSLRRFSSINQYKLEEQKIINEMSPLRATSFIIPQDEIKRLIHKYKMINKLNDKYIITYPDYIIIDYHLSKYLNTKSNYKEIDKNSRYIIFQKINS